jgi:hypothetical protein
MNDVIGISTDLSVEDEKNGAVEWIRTTTVLLPPAPQAGASASSATTALRFGEFIIDGPKNSTQLLAPSALRSR